MCTSDDRNLPKHKPLQDVLVPWQPVVPGAGGADQQCLPQPGILIPPQLVLLEPPGGAPPVVQVVPQPVLRVQKDPRFPFIEKAAAELQAGSLLIPYVPAPAYGSWLSPLDGAYVRTAALQFRPDGDIVTYLDDLHARVHARQ